MSGAVTSSQHGPVLRCTLDNPEQRNAMTPAMLVALREAVQRAGEDPSVRVVVLRGAGGAFSSGFAIDRFPAPEDLQPHDDLERLCRAIETTPVVVLAAIEGLCVGAALDVACACDLRVVVADARLGITPARLGLVYGWAGTQRVQRTAGRDAARELFFTGQLVRADSPVGRGLTSHVVEDADALEVAVARLASGVADAAPLAVAGAKATFAALDEVTSIATDVEGRLHRLRQEALGSADCAEARAAFAERRAPRFTGG